MYSILYVNYEYSFGVLIAILTAIFERFRLDATFGRGGPAEFRAVDSRSERDKWGQH